MKSKICRCLGIIVILFLSLAVLAACGKKGTKPNLGTYFSKEEVSSWEKEAKKCPYTMNGGYYISFH